MDRAPGLSVRLKLTLSYAGFLMLAGALLLAAVWVFLLRYVPDRATLIDASDNSTRDVFPIRSNLLHVFAPRAAAVFAFLLVFGLVGGWILAGRMLGPVTRITDATRRAADGSLSHRIQLEGRNDEFRELADSFDAMLARLEVHVAEQRRFAANASHELRTPLAITHALLDVARNDPDRDTGELVDRLHVVNARAIDLTEALLLLSRSGPTVLHARTRRPVAHRGRSHRNASPLRRGARRHHRDLRRRDAHHRFTRAAASDGDEPRAQRDRPQPARPGHRVGHDQQSRRACGADCREHWRAAHPAAGLHACGAVSSRHRTHTHRPRRCRPRPGRCREHHARTRRNPHPHPPGRWRPLRHGATPRAIGERLDGRRASTSHGETTPARPVVRGCLAGTPDASFGRDTGIIPMLCTVKAQRSTA